MKNETPENEGLHYQNGQSDAEKLMRRHLQNADDEITDEELKALKVGATTTDTAAPVSHSEDLKEANDEDEKEAPPPNPWDVLG